MSSILNDVKHKIGPSEDYDYYDRDIIDAINMAFGILTQLGVGPDSGFNINDASTQWEDYVTETTVLNMVQSYIYLKVRVLFDPPTNSAVLTNMGEQIKELEWRLNVETDVGKMEVV